MTTEDEAELERGAAAGDAASRFALGTTLLTGERAARDGHRGISLIRAAAEQDHPGALERQALFSVMGIEGPPDWERALDLLQRAAEIGSRRAAAQLSLLGSLEGAEASADGWAGLRRRIKVDRLFEVGEKRVISETPRVRAIDGFLAPQLCEWLISVSRGRLSPATIFDKEAGTLRQDPARSNSSVEYQLIDMDLVIELVRTRISVATRLPLPLFETSQVLHYSVGQAFHPHFDFLDPANSAYDEQFARLGQRIATFLIYLSDDFEGGETAFPSAGLNYRGAAGDALFFANVDQAGNPDRLTLHAGMPPTSGEKWIFSQWIRNRPPAPMQP